MGAPLFLFIAVASSLIFFSSNLLGLRSRGCLIKSFFCYWSMIDKFMEGFLVLHTADFDPSQDYWVHCYVIYKGQYWNLLVWFAVDQNIFFSF